MLTISRRNRRQFIDSRHSRPVMSETLRPQFFITRQNGAFVPLIALDELPPILYLRDVSRTLTPAETQGMQSVGAVVSRNQYYFVEGFVPQNSQSIGFPYSNTTLFPTRSLTPGSPSTAQPWQHPNNHRTWLRNAHGHGSNGEQAGEVLYTHEGHHERQDPYRD